MSASLLPPFLGSSVHACVPLVHVRVCSFLISFGNSSLYRLASECVSVHLRTRALTLMTIFLYAGVFIGVGVSFALPYIK